MKVEINRFDEESVEIIIEGCRPYFVNTLRRILMEDLPQIAIEDIVIYDNTSALFDEIIAHRLGLIPILYREGLRPRSECSCKGEGCANCTVHFTLSKEGPCAIQSGDLVPENPDFSVVDPSIPLLELAEGHRLILEASAVLGTGKEHAKWQGVSGAGYKYYPEIKIDLEKCDGCASCVSACPRNCLELVDKKVVVKNIEDCSICKACVDACGMDSIKVSGNENKIIFHFDTDGKMGGDKAVLLALEIFDSKLKDLKKSLGGIK
jgi:DNA-directed RNA polymerase subunit D